MKLKFRRRLVKLFFGRWQYTRWCRRQYGVMPTTGPHEPFLICNLNTAKEREAACKILEKMGCRWSDGDMPTIWQNYNNIYNCFYIWNGRIYIDRTERILTNSKYKSYPAIWNIDKIPYRFNQK